VDSRCRPLCSGIRNPKNRSIPAGAPLSDERRSRSHPHKPSMSVIAICGVTWRSPVRLVSHLLLLALVMKLIQVVGDK
jgi:hypothetical protein